MKDNVVAPLAPVTTEGSLADLPVRNAAENASETAFSRKTPSGGWTDVTWAQFADDVAGRRQGPDRRRRRARRPGRPHVAHPLRVDPRRLRHLERRRRRRADLRDLLRRAGAVDPRRLRRHGRRRRDRRPPRAPSTQVRGDLPRSATSGIIDAGGLDALREKGRRGRRRRARRPPRRRSTATSVATIIYTSGTTGRPKGCELTHGNFLDLAENAIEKLGQVVLDRRRLDAALPPLAHVFARFIEVLCVAGRRTDGPLRRHQDPARRLRRVPADLRPRRPPRLREDLQLRRGQGRGRGQGQDLRRAPRPSRSPTARRWTPAAPASGCGSSTRSSTGSSTASCAPPWAARCSTPSPAARRSAPASATSTAASASSILEGYGLTETTAPVDGQHARTRSRSARSGRRCPASASGSPTTARSCSRASTSSRGYHDNDDRDRGAGRATAGSTPATSASSTTTASCGSPAARRRSS